MADALGTVTQLCAEHELDARRLAGRSGVDERRVLAIVWMSSEPYFASSSVDVPSYSAIASAARPAAR